MSAIELNEVSKEKLISDFKVVVADAEDLLKATASQAGEKISAARARAEESLKAAKVKLAQAEEVVMARPRKPPRPPTNTCTPSRQPSRCRRRGLCWGLLIGRR